MRRKLLFLLGLILLGTASYYSAYRLYVGGHPKVVLEEPMTLLKSKGTEQEVQKGNEQEYYLAKIEQEMLLVYKMPEKSIYDSMNADSLQFQEKDFLQLENGMVFEDLKEVFEFLESCMS